MMTTQLILFFMAIEDIRTMQVSNVYQIVLLGWILLSGQASIGLLLLSALIYGSYLLINKKFETKIGGADIKLFCILLLLGIKIVILIAFWSSLFGLIYSLVTHKKKIPFVPFIWIGYCLVYI